MDILENLKGTKCLALFHSNEKYERVFHRIRYLIGLKSNISDHYFYKDTKTKINSDNDLPSENTINIDNVVILIKPVFNKNDSHYCYHVFLEKCSYK